MQSVQSCAPLLLRSVLERNIERSRNPHAGITVSPHSSEILVPLLEEGVARWQERISACCIQKISASDVCNLFTLKIRRRRQLPCRDLVLLTSTSLAQL